MHRRHYILIAKTIRNIIPFVSEDTRETITSAFCKTLKDENPSFNEQKFKEYIKKGDER